MDYMRVYILLFFVACSLGMSAMNISGRITDKDSGNGLPYASIALKNKQIGTISNEEGYFEFFIPDENRSDTLLVNYIGYEGFQKPLSEMKEGQKLQIKLVPVMNELDEITIHPISPLDYIDRINNAIADNYSPVPFKTSAYYRERMKENQHYVRNEEAIFESYYTGCTDTARSRHKIILWRENGPVGELKFDKQWILKQADKQKRKTLHNAEFADAQESDDGYIDFGGPNTLLSFDFTKTQQPFLDVSNRKKYTYTIGNKSVYNGREVLTIYFETDKKIDNTLYKGYFLMDEQSYAIIYIEMSGRYVVPTLLQPLVTLYGVTINESDYSLSVKYENFNGRWYPKDIHGTLAVDAVRKHMFGSDSHYNYQMDQLFLVNKIVTENIQPIPASQGYKVGKSMRNQVFPDGKTTWENLNIVK